MSIPFKYKFNQVKGILRKEGHPLFDVDDKKWIVWWYGGIVKNHKAPTQTYIKVVFRQILNDQYDLSDTVHDQKVCITTLGQLRIGSVWKNNICIEQAIFKTEDFDVDYTKGSWSVKSFELAKKQNGNPPFNLEEFKLFWNLDKNFLLEFPLSNNYKLIIPCLEFFARCYGRSSELKRILTTFPWDGVSNSSKDRLYAPLDEGEIDDGSIWKVKLKVNLVNDDVVLLAHAKYDLDFAQKNIKLIYSQIESNYDNVNPNRPIFIKVLPWFEGLAQIRVSGIKLTNGDFLALNILGSSEPEGREIQRDRVLNDQTTTDTSGSYNSYDNLEKQRASNIHPEILSHSSEHEPDHDSTLVEVFDPTFVTLGNPRKITDVRRDKIKKLQEPKNEKIKVTITDDLFTGNYASGDNYGIDKNVNKVIFKSISLLESKGVLLGMWEAMQFLKDKHPNQISSVEWFTFDDNFQSIGTPRLIALTPFDFSECKKLKYEIRTWPYLKFKSSTIRGAIVARIIVDSRYIYIIEIQRRSKADSSSTSNDSYTGLVFESEDIELARKIIITFLDKIRYEKGVVKRTLSQLECNANFFMHKSAKGNDLHCQNAVIKALGKMGIKLKEEFEDLKTKYLIRNSFSEVSQFSNQNV